jgi:acyl carrier protein
VVWRWGCEPERKAWPPAGEKPAAGEKRFRRECALRSPNTDEGGAQVSDATFDKFKSCTIDVLQVPEDKVVPEARFGDDLDADSLDLVELVMALEEAFDITVEESEIEGIETVGQAYELVSAKL